MTTPRAVSHGRVPGGAEGVISAARLTELLAELRAAEDRLDEHGQREAALQRNADSSMRHGADLESHARAAEARRLAHESGSRAACAHTRLRLRRCALLHRLAAEGMPQGRWVSHEDALFRLEPREERTPVLHELSARHARWIPDDEDERPEITLRRAAYAGSYARDRRQLLLFALVMTGTYASYHYALDALLSAGQFFGYVFLPILAVALIALPGARRAYPVPNRDHAADTSLSPWLAVAPGTGTRIDPAPRPPRLLPARCGKPAPDSTARREPSEPS